MSSSRALLIARVALCMAGALGQACQSPAGTAGSGTPHAVDAAAPPPPLADVGPAREPRDAGAGAPFPPVPGPVPTSLGLDPFYARYVDAGGIPIVASAGVSDAAFAVAWTIVSRMTRRPDLLEALRHSGARVAIMATAEVTTDIPEHAILPQAFPDIDWDEERRGLGATLEIPITTVGEENLLGLDRDVYRGESVLVHEWAHATLTLGLRALSDAATDATALDDAYAAARDEGTWTDTYASTSVDEYFAEGAQTWFEVNGWARPPDGRHNDVSTRGALLARDPPLGAVLARVFLDAPPLP